MDKLYICIFLTICNFVYNCGEYCENCLENCCCEYFNCFGKDNSNQNNQDYANKSQLFKEIFPKYEGKIIDINEKENQKYLIYDILNSIYEKYNKENAFTNNFKEENYEIKLKNKNVKITKKKSEDTDSFDFIIEIDNFKFEITLCFLTNQEEENKKVKEIVSLYFPNKNLIEKYLGFCFKNSLGYCMEHFDKDICTEIGKVKYSVELFNRLALDLLKLQKFLVEKNLFFPDLRIFLKKNNDNEKDYVWRTLASPITIIIPSDMDTKFKNAILGILEYSCFDLPLEKNNENFKIRLANEELFLFAVKLYCFKEKEMPYFVKEDLFRKRNFLFKIYCDGIEKNNDHTIYDRIFLKFKEGIDSKKIDCEYINVDDLIEELEKSLENSPSVMN